MRIPVISLLVLLLAVAAFAGTETTVENNLEITSTTNCWPPHATTATVNYNPVANPDSGVFVVLLHPDTAGTTRMYALISTDYGATWGYTEVIGPGSPSGWHVFDVLPETTMIWGHDFGDSAIVTGVISGAVVDSSAVNFDRIDAANRGGVFKVGGRFCIEYNVDAAAGSGSDSSIVVIADSDGWPPSGWHLGPVLNASKMGYGKRMQVNLGDGFAAFHRRGGDNDFWIIDTTSGHQEILTTNFGLFPGGAAGELGSNDIIMLDDSIGVFVSQPSISAGEDSLIVRRFWITDYAGTPGVSFGSYAKIVDEADITDGTYTYPQLQWRVGTDIIDLFFMRDSIVYVSVSEDRGATWGSAVQFYEPTAPRYRLQAFDWLYPNADGAYLRTTYYTGSNAADDVLYQVQDTIAAGAAPVATFTVPVVMPE